MPPSYHRSPQSSRPSPIAVNRGGNGIRSRRFCSLPGWRCLPAGAGSRGSPIGRRIMVSADALAMLLLTGVVITGDAMFTPHAIAEADRFLLRNTLTIPRDACGSVARPAHAVEDRSPFLIPSTVLHLSEPTQGFVNHSGKSLPLSPQSRKNLPAVLGVFLHEIWATHQSLLPPRKRIGRPCAVTRGCAPHGGHAKWSQGRKLAGLPKRGEARPRAREWGIPLSPSV